jgi:hypothetical protein
LTCRKHGNGTDVLIGDGHDRQLVTNEALVLKDDPHIRYANESGADANAIVYGINLFALKKSGLDLLELFGFVMDDLGHK